MDPVAPETVREMIAYAIKQVRPTELNALRARDYGQRDTAAWRIAERVHAQLKLCGCDVVKQRTGSRNYSEPMGDEQAGDKP